MGRNSLRNTLFVGGLSIYTRPRDVAAEFEKFGELVRCDIPTPGGRSKGFAFIEYVDERDAEDAYHALKHKKIDGREVAIQWAKRNPSSEWKSRSETGSSERRRSRSRSPRRRSRSRSPHQRRGYEISGAGRHSPSYRRRYSPSPPRTRELSPRRGSPPPPRRELSPRRGSPPPPRRDISPSRRAQSPGRSRLSPPYSDIRGREEYRRDAPSRDGDPYDRKGPN